MYLSQRTDKYNEDSWRTSSSSMICAGEMGDACGVEPLLLRRSLLTVRPKSSVARGSLRNSSSAGLAPVHCYSPGIDFSYY